MMWAYIYDFLRLWMLILSFEKILEFLLRIPKSGKPTDLISSFRPIFFQQYCHSFYKNCSCQGLQPTIEVNNPYQKCTVLIYRRIYIFKWLVRQRWSSYAAPHHGLVGKRGEFHFISYENYVHSLNTTFRKLRPFKLTCPQKRRRTLTPASPDISPLIPLMTSRIRDSFQNHVLWFQKLDFPHILTKKNWEHLNLSRGVATPAAPDEKLSIHQISS